MFLDLYYRDFGVVFNVGYSLARDIRFPRL